jgi:CRISPR-associated endonuclease/helicase Cas3
VKAYPYQKRVHQYLMSGENVILQAPTGAGKTRAALYPYLENLEGLNEKERWPQTRLPLTCRYAVPMRVLATQFEREYHRYFEKMEQKRGTRFADRYTQKLGIAIPAIQTGEAAGDPKFESLLTFCTIDQLLASFIGTPYAIGLGQANLNIGAVIGSYLVLDEFHLYPLDKGGNGARMTTLAMLRLLKDLSPFILMTATFSTRLLTRLANLLNARIVRVDDPEELQQIMQGRMRTLRQEDAPMTPEAILSAHDAARERGAGASLVVCNTVGRAQEMYLRLRHALEQEGRSTERLMLLHSRFTQQDRSHKSKELERWLGKDRWDKKGTFLGEDTIVVGTQVVEVGLNISAGVLHTELAPANSLIQRAGRCARFAQQRGDVIVYRIPPREEDKQPSYLPYDAHLCEATRAHLEALIAQAGRSALPFGFEEEQALIDAVHTEEDEQMLDRFEQNEGQIKRPVMDVLATHEPGKEGTLIRNVRQVAVLVHGTPEQTITTKPFTWESFGLHPNTLMGAWNALDAHRLALGFEAPGWTMKQMVAVSDTGDSQEEDSRREPVYTWDPITNPRQVLSALRIALPPELATYDSELGFRLLLDGQQQTTEWQSPQTETRRGTTVFKKRTQRSYVEHISGLLHAYEWSVQRELVWVADRLERALSLPARSIDQAIRLAIACHDIGKLGRGWQRWAHDWQELLVKERGPMYRIQAGRELLAKTDGLDDWKEEQLLKKQLRMKRPPQHACASVMASAMLIAQRLATGLTDERQKEGGLALTRATLSAIARHHTPTATTYEAVEWDQGAAAPVIERALSACRLPSDLTGLNLGALRDGEVSGDWLLKPGYETRVQLYATWLGFVIVRALRLCDQRAETEW